MTSRRKRRRPPELPLAGQTILITRSRSQGREFAGGILRLGGNPVFFPTIEIVGPASWTECDEALGSLPQYDGLMFTSANGVRFFLARARACNANVGSLRSKQLFVVGRTTERVAARHGLKATAVPETYDSNHMALLFENVRGKRFLFPHGNLSRDTLASHVRSLGAGVDAITVYRTTKPEGEQAPEIREQLLSGTIDVITFASPSAAVNFAAMFSPSELRTIAGKVTVAAIGGTTKTAAERVGMKVEIVPPHSSITSLLESIVAHVQAGAHAPRHASPGAG